jgi:hypothetical protein
MLVVLDVAAAAGVCSDGAVFDNRRWMKRVVRTTPHDAAGWRAHRHTEERAYHELLPEIDQNASSRLAGLTCGRGARFRLRCWR